MKLRIPSSSGRGVKERERAVEDRVPEVLVAAAGERERDDGKPRDVVDAVAAVAVRDDSVRVLHDAHVVDQREQVVGAQARQVQVADTRRAAAGRELVCLLEHDGRRLGDRRPRERGADAPRLEPRQASTCGCST